MYRRFLFPVIIIDKKWGSVLFLVPVRHGCKLLSISFDILYIHVFFMHIKVAVFVKIMLFQEKVILRGSQILMEFGIYNDVSPKDTYLKYFCVQLKIAMENTIFKFP